MTHYAKIELSHYDYTRLCKYHAMPTWLVIDSDENTRVCDECFEHCRYYVVDKNGKRWEIKGNGNNNQTKEE